MSYQVHFCFAKNDRKKQKLQQNKSYSNYSIHLNSMSPCMWKGSLGVVRINRLKAPTSLVNNVMSTFTGCNVQCLSCDWCWWLCWAVCGNWRNSHLNWKITRQPLDCSTLGTWHQQECYYIMFQSSSSNVYKPSRHKIVILYEGPTTFIYIFICTYLRNLYVMSDIKTKLSSDNISCHVYGTLMENLSSFSRAVSLQNVSLPRNFNIPRN